MKIENKHESAFVSKSVETHEATISMTPEVFDLMISGIYKNKIQAPVRELTSNARDSHVEAGINEPVRMHAPTVLEPWFSVKDVGLGMDKDMVTKTYMCFGTSTERESNELIGAKGIGSKSPFALVDGFQVISIYNGTQTSYSVYRDSGLPKIAAVHEKPTDERNGVEVKFAVPPSLITRFNENIQDFLSYFDYPVEVNTPLPEKREIAFSGMYEDFKVDILMKKRDDNRVVMGGVAYRSSYLERRHDDGVIVTIPIGACDIDPGREWTVENHTTKDFSVKLKAAIDYVTEKYAAKVKAEIDQKKTVADCLEWYKNLTHRAKGMANEVLYKRFALGKDVLFCYRPWNNKGNRDTPRISDILEGNVIFLVKDKKTLPMVRAKKLMAQQKAEVCFTVNADSKIIDEPFLDGFVFKASEVAIDKEQIDKKKAEPKDRLKGHKVYILDSSGLRAEQVSKVDIENAGSWIPRDIVVSDSYYKKLMGITTKDVGDFKVGIDYSEFLSRSGVESIMFLSEHQAKWGKAENKFVLSLGGEVEKVIAASFLRARTYNSHVAMINNLRAMQGIPGRLQAVEQVSVPRWLPDGLVNKLNEQKKLQEKAEEKLHGVESLSNEMQKEVNKNYPLVAMLNQPDYTSQEVKEYVKAIRKLRGEA